MKNRTRISFKEVMVDDTEVTYFGAIDCYMTRSDDSVFAIVLDETGGIHVMELDDLTHHEQIQTEQDLDL